ncbi:uncharacterized protein J7T54_001747 [Emericellopsis cladophorae]|uniref:Uncharacterized protein n=1 Tax=Emericellopsis cladophorae TaxID=2686198 RepID=A0A9P9Y5M5_9HYPO|nr:uncharacterized protein J7T54_001747 [Emericellopsis cladophorae]KAI6783871.1 hypothetical protein J7T54_001747 [Emericellopsis cladophorae]
MPPRRAAAGAKAEAAKDVVLDAASNATEKVVKAEEDVKDAVVSGGEFRDPYPDMTIRRPKLPAYAQFPLAATLSFALASTGYSLLGEYTKGELASVSRSQDTWGEVGILAGWRLIELGLGWFGNMDSIDVAAMDLLSHGPSLYLLTAFYGLSPSTGMISLLVDITSAAVPFYLLRPLSAVHSRSSKLHNRELVGFGLQAYTTALSTGIYAVTIVLSLRLLLPRILVIYFSGLPTLEPAYSASYAALLPVALAFGAAASNFIYPPFATTDKVKDDEKIGEFDPATATLRETVEWNIAGYTAKTKVIVRRTATAAFVTAFNTYLACTMTVYGIASTGAATYAAVWVSAVLTSGLGLAYVGSE